MEKKVLCVFLLKAQKTQNLTKTVSARKYTTVLSCTHGRFYDEFLVEAMKPDL